MRWLEPLLCPLAALAERYGALAEIAVLIGVAAGGVIGSSVVRWLSRILKMGGGTLSSGWVASALIATFVYVACLAADPLLKAALDPPHDISPAAWGRVGFFEIELLGDWAWPFLPLSEHPAAGIAIHLALWIAVIALVRALLQWIYRGTRIDWNTPQAMLPFYYRWVGASSARRADERFSRWLWRLLWFAWPIFLLCGLLVANESRRASLASRIPQCLEQAQALATGGSAMRELTSYPIAGAPPIGAWVLAGLLLFGLTVHLVLEGSPSPEPEPTKDEEDDDELPAAPPDPLRRLGDALQAKLPGAFLEALEEHPGAAAELHGFHAEESPLLAEALRALTEDPSAPTPDPEVGEPGAEEPTARAELYSHQREVLDHLRAVWTMSAPSALGAAPTLREEVGPAPVQTADLSTPHALVLAPEGAGRTTLAMLAALYVHLDRGATTLVLVRDHAAARAWVKRLTDALARSSARWNVHVACAGEDLADVLVAGRTPAVVVASLDALEADVLGAARTDKFFASLGLFVVDDADRMCGVAEMHAHMVMRRTWALLETLHDAPYPTVLLGVVGPSASGMASWARHVLAAPLRVFDADGAPRVARAVLRRRDLADASGEAIPLRTVAEACEAAQVPWHLRRAGDASRHERTFATELGQLRRHHKMDPLDAEVILLEGRYPDVFRESERLAHAGLRTGRASVVLVLAPPADEEMVLHEEAIDATQRERIRELPRAIPLAEPNLVRQRHLDRALGREQSVAALRDRFGADLVDDVLERLDAHRRVRYRDVWHFDAATDQAASRRLVRAADESAIGEPIRADCVSDSRARARVVDRGTSEVLREVDAAIAPASYSPGAIFEHARGRYQVLERNHDGDFICEQITEAHRTTPSVQVHIELEDPTFEVRELGGSPIEVAMSSAHIKESVHAIRRYAPGPALVERRRYPDPIASELGSEACVIHVPLEPAAIVPIVAGLRMMIPCAFRGAAELAGVAYVEIGERRGIAFYDRTPGASGLARSIAESGLAELLALARHALERLVGPVSSRLHHLHDATYIPDLSPEGWRVTEALGWLDRVLEVPSAPGADPARHGRRRVEWTPGEGPGDLGRLWISATGRSDDLVWTRHRFTSRHALGGQPAGPVFLDVAIERRTIAWAIRKAQMAGAPSVATEVRDPGVWMTQHHAALSTASDDLVAIYAHLARLSQEHLVDTVLAVVASIPTHPSPLPVCERAPIAALSRRRADRDAKCLLAWALLPTAVHPTIRLTDDGPVLQIARSDGEPEVVDLSGDAIRSVTGDTGAALALSWGEDAPPEEAAADDPDPEG
ncbi:MAG: DEAD/DEAH box helicase [Sandaracinaceae bacterium]